ncbi:hypothetical protein LAY57_03025 [Argonema antarcticum A004/B2]|nr:hypothetical protein [Argonema antarcticum A004/B2]
MSLLIERTLTKSNIIVRYFFANKFSVTGKTGVLSVSWEFLPSNTPVKQKLVRRANLMLY